MPLLCRATMCVSLSLILPSFCQTYESKSTVNFTPEQKLSRFTWLVVTPPSKSLMSVSGQVTYANLLSQKGFGVLGRMITLISKLCTGTEDLYLCLQGETSDRIHQCQGGRNIDQI